MLKIKDNVNLKELEKYGYIPIYSETTGKVSGLTHKYYSSWFLVFKKIKKRKIFSKDKNMFILNCKTKNGYVDIDYSIVDDLYDLIKDGLVEKVDK